MVIFQISKFHKYPLFVEGGLKHIEGGGGNQGMNFYKGVKIQEYLPPPFELNSIYTPYTPLFAPLWGPILYQ